MIDLCASYDKFADVLYLSVGRPVRSITHPDENNILWRESLSDHSLVGATIIDYAEDWKGRRDSLAHTLAERFLVPEQQVLDRLPIL